MLLLKNKYLLDIIASVMFFTRIPVNWSYFSNKPPDLTQAAWSFPLVGLLIGLIAGLIGDLFIYLEQSIFLSCVISITISVLLTGAFHEDGLADSADGLGAGGSPEKINKIIHDSRLGTYGVVAIILGLLFRLALIQALVESGYSLVSILSIAFASGKLAIIFTRNFFKHSKFAKIGSIVGKVSHKQLVCACLIWALPTLLIFPFLGVFFGIIFTISVILILGIKAKKVLGGITGDILGAIAFLTELTFLIGNTVVIGI
ncbi:MAG: adenosylcobinamide-GDP ribazoletransferase [Rickettsiales bacterium]|nr:adenosylcobinamide-GDP ribazoletransferase [Rickettsiales bacterium]OUV52798.1 MAG: adenosylcobinamide-GDP ribazoletransferase [Rickettsiales bacterium TMED127]|tara:strand:- start:19367 stop:20143 length:777 start_codon:yes stop_codon:yes gene_type:complete